MIIAKTTVLFTALAVSTFSVISAQTREYYDNDDDAVEIDTAVPKTTKMPKNKKTTKMPKNKKGKKGGKAVHTKSGKKGKKSTSPNSSSTTTAPSSSQKESTSPNSSSTTISPSSSPTSSLTSSPTGVCEQSLALTAAARIQLQVDDLKFRIKQVNEDPVLSQVPAVGTVLDQSGSITEAIRSALFGEATGCDFDTSLELFKRNKRPDESQPSQLAKVYRCTMSESSGSEMGRKLQDNPLTMIVELAQTIISIFLDNLIFYDKLNKAYPPYMGLLDEIPCTYYALSFAVVDIVKALSEQFTGTAIDLSSPFHEKALRCALIVYEEGDFFPDVFTIPTVFDAAACVL